MILLIHPARPEIHHPQPLLSRRGARKPRVPDTPKPRLSIVVVTWNGRALLERCLPSVLAHADGAEVVVADNASTDGTAEWLAAHAPAARVVRLDENRGFCGGNNAGYRAAAGEFVLFLNNDVEVAPGWTRPLLAWMDARPACAAVAPKLLRHDQRDRFEYAGAAGGYLDRDGFPFARGRLFTHLEADRGQHDAPRRVFWATGAALLLRRSALGADERPFDERFYLHMEEIELCWRLQRRGHEVWCVPGSVAYHIGGASLPQGDPRKAYYNYRNGLLMLYRHLPPPAFRRVLARRVALDAVAAARAVVRGNPKEAAAIGRAYRDARRMAPRFADERPAAGTPSPFPPYHGSIVADFFLRGVRAFGDLNPRKFSPPFRAGSSA